MKRKTKKIIAKEILILSSILVLALIIYGALHLWMNHKQETFKNIIKQETSLLKKIRKKENSFDAEYGVIVKNPNTELRKLYEKINKKYDVGTFDEYISKMYKPTKRIILYQAVKNDYDLGTFEEFEESLGFNKIYETPNGTKVKATELMDKYGKRFDTLLDQKYLTPEEKPTVIQEKANQSISNKKSDFDQIEQLKKEKNNLSEKINNSDYSINVNNIFYTVILGLLILAYPLRIFIFGIKWAIKNIRN
jgi:uncharacterized protein YxeA